LHWLNLTADHAHGFRDKEGVTKVGRPTIGTAAMTAAERQVRRRRRLRMEVKRSRTEWYTPAKYIEMARAVMGGIDVDPASNEFAQRTVQARTFYTRETNGLAHEWHGRVWLNPPYNNREISAFVEKLLVELEARRATDVVVLADNRADAAWHHSLQAICDRLCVTRGRIKFESPTLSGAGPAIGQVFFYFGPNGRRFNRVFSEIGKVWLRESIADPGAGDLFARMRAS
jgi:phage N-6-adenine-methyltransferase